MVDGEHYKPQQTQPINLHEVIALQDVQVREGVTLRPMDASDATRMLEILEADTSIRDRVSVASKMHAPEDVEAQVESYKQDEHLIRYAILEGDNPIGLVSFWRDVDNPFDAPDNPDDYGFGYFLDPAKRGSGIVTDAVRTIMDVSARNIHINQFIAYCEDNNPDSVAVLTKLGFQPTDTVLVEQNSGWTERKYVRKPGGLTSEGGNQAPERLGSDIDTQFDWVKGEMGYSRDKVKGYEEKLVRLGREPDDPTSVFGFMSNYWHRFRQAADTLNTVREPLAASRALQANAKVVAGLSDKVAFALWLEDRAAGTTHEPEWLIDTALGMIRERVEQTAGEYTDEQLLAYVDKPFEENPMGQAILALHQEHGHNPHDTEILRIIAVEGSAWGILMSQAYSRNLEQSGLSSVMPKPGISSGNIETWD